MPVYSFFDEYDLAGKEVVVYVTHEGSGLGSGERDVKRICEGATFGKGLAVHGADAPHSEKTVSDWAKSQV